MITNFKETRRDGNVIDESMTIEDIVGRGWGIDKIVAVSWDDGNRLVERRTTHGMLVKPLPDRSGVACLEDSDDTALYSQLSILNADGSLRFEIPNTQIVNGKAEAGQYGWFNPARVPSATHIGIVFCLDRNQYDYQVDIDTSSGAVAGVYPTR